MSPALYNWKGLGRLLHSRVAFVPRLRVPSSALSTGKRFWKPYNQLPTPPQITMDACSDSFLFGRENRWTSNSIFCYFWVSWLYIYHLNIKSIPTRIQLHMVLQTHTVSPIWVFTTCLEHQTQELTARWACQLTMTPQFWKVQVVSTAFWCQ